MTANIRLMVVEWPDGLLPGSPRWEAIAGEVNRARADLLLTNEMPFGRWLPTTPHYQDDRAQAWVALHDQGVEALAELKVGAVLSTRPVACGDRLANEAFSLVDGHYAALHHKHLFPAEDGWQEASWFKSARPGFDVHDVAGIRVGLLVCTELMFNEHARALGRSGAQLIAVPRATGSRVDSWEVAARMAALVGGCYVASSNRCGHAPGAAGPDFGGHGFVVAPGGKLIQHTQRDAMSLITDLDLDLAHAAKQAYPCYVQDLPITPHRDRLGP